MILIKIFLFILTFSFLAFGWGNEGHSLINKKAVDLLAEKNPAFLNWKEYLIGHASDPDKRRDSDPTEFPKHFIDIDYYPEFHQNNMIKNKEKLVDQYGDSIVTKMGILPWSTLIAFEHLKKAFAEKNRDKALIYAVDLAHYISDAYNPMHTMLNYDGQLTGQNGIHARYESDMVRKNLTYFDNTIRGENIHDIENKLDYIFDYISQSHYLGPVLFAADKSAYETVNSVASSEYYSLLFERTRYTTEIQMKNAAESIASLIYAAWKEAGEPQIEKLN